jgi:hypothetical protein
MPITFHFIIQINLRKEIIGFLYVLSAMEPKCICKDKSLNVPGVVLSGCNAVVVVGRKKCGVSKSNVKASSVNI